jgi:poly-D-alanine transfer protein DltD
MQKRKTQQLTLKEIEKLLSQQTKVILNAVDERLAKTELRILNTVDQKLVKTELRIARKIDRLTTTLDKFLKRLTDIEDEFEIMKADINRLKRIIGEKLGVEIL